jgi:hypothetical protein
LVGGALVDGTSGVEMSGVETSGVETSGVEMSGVEMSDGGPSDDVFPGGMEFASLTALGLMMGGSLIPNPHHNPPTISAKALAMSSQAGRMFFR